MTHNTLDNMPCVYQIWTQKHGAQAVVYRDLNEAVRNAQLEAQGLGYRNVTATVEGERALVRGYDRNAGERHWVVSRLYVSLGAAE